VAYLYRLTEAQDLEVTPHIYMYGLSGRGSHSPWRSVPTEDGIQLAPKLFNGR
jgi:hypothetical protein